MRKLNSLINFIIGLMFFSFSFLLPAEISLDVNLIKTGQYNVSDFLDPSVNLWTVNIHCTDCTVDESVFYIIEVRLNFNEINPAIWGITYLRNVSYERPNDVLTNYDFQDGEGLLNEYNQDDVFISLLEENYYLPAGTVSLNVTAFLCEPGPLEDIPWIHQPDYFEYTCGDVDLNIFDSSVSGTILASDQENVQNNVVSELKLLGPAINSNVLDPYPWFRWESPGFLNGVRIDYTLYVYLFDPILHSSYSDAIEDDNFLYFMKEITQNETGIPQQIQVQYPSDDRDLACGYQYVWYIEAKDIIQDPPFNGETGIWGWPEPTKSPLYVFNYGAIIRSENVVTPSIGSEISTVRPSFYVDPIDCADSYEIWLSHKEDSEVENPLWVSSALQTNVNVYPSDATGLVPGSDYKWKIRVNPDGVPGPWSDIFNFKVGGYTLDDPISGVVLNTISPTFYFTGPSDIAGFELRISNSDDPTVEYGNIFNDYVQSFPFELPTDIPVGLLSGGTYYWKLIFFDGNENIVGAVDDYTMVESFLIGGVELISPSDGTSDLHLTPSFMWDGPLGVSQYEYSLSKADDPSIEDPIFTTNVSGTFFQYPQYGDHPLEYGQLYYWKVVPLDMNGHRGLSSEHYSFSTATNLSESSTDEVSYTKSEFSLSGGTESSPKDIIVNLLVGVTGAEEYIIYFSNDQEMGSYLAELTIDADQTEVILNGENLDWGLTVYAQIVAIVDGEILGEESSIQIINLPTKPGSDEQVGITVSLENGSIQPIIEIINVVTNAIDYVIEIASDAEMTEIFFSGPILVDMPTEYPESADPLMFGETYYFQVYANDDDGLHGIPSNIIPIFIPNVTPPVLKDEYAWEATVPVSSSYTIQISATDDFSSIVVEELIDGTSFTPPAGILDPGTVYYWRVQGYDANGDQFSEVSITRYFETEGEQTVIEDTEGGQIVVLQLPPVGEEVTTLKPSFQWDLIETAEEYEIRISANEDYSHILWKSSKVAQNGVQYPSSGAEALLAETVYYWSVRAISEDIALGEYSQSFIFTVSNDNQPVLTGPMNGTSESILPFFTWNKISRASTYGLILGNTEDLSQIIFENHSISDKQFQYVEDAPPLEYDTVYYWKVIAYDDNGVPLGDYSLTATFTTPTGIIQIEFIYEKVGG